MKAEQGSHAQGQARRDEYIRLRLEGLDAVTAGAQLDLPLVTRARYERWARTLHPELPEPPKTDWGQLSW